MAHTKQHIQNLLQAAQTHPRHHWGQNFLIDLNLMRLLVDRAELTKDDVVLEVGCGTGSLSSLLAESAGHVIAVDIDPDLFKIAQGELADFDNITFIGEDALHNKNTISHNVTAAIKEARQKFNGAFKLVANLPYQIASPLMLNFLQSDTLPDGMLVTIQAEVGERMLAQVGSNQYGQISIMMQATGQVEMLRRLPPQAFWPAPKVHSAMIVWQQDEEKLNELKSIASLSDTIDLLMGHRRKKISTCLKKAGTDCSFQEILADLEIDPNLRGEALSPQQYVQLANALSNAIKPPLPNQ